MSDLDGWLSVLIYLGATIGIIAVVNVLARKKDNPAIALTHEDEAALESRIAA